MHGPSLLETLRGIRFLDDMPDAGLQLLARAARLEGYEPEAVIFREGEPLDRVFLVAQGSVALEALVPEHGARWIQTIPAGELLGWSAVLGRPPLTATARAVTPCRLVVVDAARILALCRHDAGFGFEFMRRTAGVLADRLSATRKLLLAAYGQCLPTVMGLHEGAD